MFREFQFGKKHVSSAFFVQSKEIETSRTKDKTSVEQRAAFNETNILLFGVYYTFFLVHPAPNWFARLRVRNSLAFNFMICYNDHVVKMVSRILKSYQDEISLKMFGFAG